MERNQGRRPGSERGSSEEILGHYGLLTQIAEGELTTVHLARPRSDGGFSPLVAIKRLKPQFARQPGCVQLLLDEARLTSALHHANVIGCLDKGMDGGCYVVQNYVEGDDLQGLLNAAGAETHARYVVPLIVDLLNGLHAVHSALDDAGVPLALVHQAPRARHLLVGTDGIARLCDFTHATARGLLLNPERSDRLKIAHIAPEQALNPDSVDHRADLFLVGVMLWEALSGQRLFGAGNDEVTFGNLLRRRVIKPSDVGFRPPRCFDAIVLRALEREPDKRYRSSLEMAHELRGTALNQALYATTGEIAQWVKGLAGARLVERRKYVGSGAGADDVPLKVPSSSSGFFQATKVGDPYGSGLIFGGSFSRLDAPGTVDPDKTPALGNRVPQGAPRAAGVVSPGAYSQVAEERMRKPNAPPPANTRRTSAPAIHVAPPVSSTALRATGPIAPAQRPVLGVAKPKTRAAVDAPSTADRRTDSKPNRLAVPSTPVGWPHRSAPSSTEPTSFELPPTPSALRELAGRTRREDLLLVPVDSLSPPNSAARTAPPRAREEPESGANRMIWIVTGLLAAIILFAVGMSVQRTRDLSAPQRVTATQPVARSVAPSPAAPPREAAQQAATPAPDAAKAPAAALPNPAAPAFPTDAPDAADAAREISPPNPSPRRGEGSRSYPLTPRDGEPPKARPRRLLPIPDNPY